METLKAKKKNGQMDFLLYVTVLLLCAFGLVMVFSASYYYAQNKASLNYDGLYYLKNQAKYMAMGLGVMIVMSRLDYHYLEKLRNVGLMVTLLLMLATVFWGEDINGAKRWLNLFDVITFQPSELAKFVLILYMASFMTRRASQMKSFTRGIVPMLIIMCIICILLLLQKNMSMMMVVMMIGFVMLFLGGADMRHLVGLCLLAVPVFFLAASMETYRWNRLVIFTNPWKDPQGNGYQLIQSLSALCSAGELETLGYYLDCWRASFAANTAAEVVGLFRTEFLTTSGALVVLLLLGLSAIGSLPIFFFMMLYGTGAGMLSFQLLADLNWKALAAYCIASGVPTALAAGCLCLFGASALQVSGKIQRCSFGKAFHSTGAWGLVGQFAQTLFLLLPICGAATGMLYLCGQMKLSF